MSKPGEQTGKPTRHKIGSARTIQTAVLVVAYLSSGHPRFGDGRTRYIFTDPTSGNGWWSADIIVDTWGEYDPTLDKELSQMVHECRAFAAGRGEIWI